MSNQVYSNRVGTGTRYLPRNSETDRLELIGGGPQTKGGCDKNGVGLFFDRMNNNDTVLLPDGSRNYAAFQSVFTRAFWVFDSRPGELGGATTIKSLQDNTIAITATVPLRHTDLSTHTMVLALNYIAPDGNQFTRYSPFQMSVPTLPAGQYATFAITDCVRLSTGNRLAVYVYKAEDGAALTIDYANNNNFTTAAIFPCFVEFAKI